MARIGSNCLLHLVIIISLMVTLITSSTNGEKYKTVKTNYGKIRGRLETTLYDEKSFYAFRGIPYAKPPVGTLRFKAPVDIEPWNDVKDTVEFQGECMQKTMLTGQIIGVEDCLFLNVYVPANLKEDTVAVMIFIHGGAFFSGSSNGYGPDFLINKNVILVTLNYRVGPLGFLSLGTAEYSGNMGLKDQLLAIKWVRNNIELFGGDTKRITIFGESAGSSSVEYHILSPASKGLYQRAILQSGSTLNPWLYYAGNDHLSYLYGLAKEYDENPKNVNELLAFLNNVDIAHFIQKSSMALTESAQRNWVPIVEVSNAIEPFLLMPALEYFNKWAEEEINIMIGFNSDELLFVTVPLIQSPEVLADVNNNFKVDLPRADWKYDVNAKEYKEILKEIRKFYIPNGGQITKDSFVKYNDIISDAGMVYGIDQAAKIHSRRLPTTKTYYYKFSLDSKLNLFKSGFGQIKHDLPGAAHADDLLYLFQLTFENVTFTHIYKSLTKDSVERKGIETITNLWSNFAKFGNPTPDHDAFPAITREQINYVDITNDGLKADVNPYGERMAFWNNLYAKYENFFIKKELRRKEEL